MSWVRLLLEHFKSIESFMLYRLLNEGIEQKVSNGCWIAGRERLCSKNDPLKVLDQNLRGGRFAGTRPPVAFGPSQADGCGQRHPVISGLSMPCL